VLLAVAATILWSTTSLFVDPLVNTYHMSPVQLSFLRSLLVTGALGIAIGVRSQGGRALSRREIPFFLIYGVVGVALFSVAWSWSVQVNKAAVATALIFSAPAFVAIGARLLFHEALSPPRLCAIALTLLGTALVAGVSDPRGLAHSPEGLVAGLASGVAFAIYTLFGRGVARMAQRGPLVVLFYVFGIAAAALLVLGLATQGAAFLAPPLDMTGWVMLVVLSLCPTLLGYVLFNASLATLPSAVASLITTLEPPIGGVLAYLFLGRAMNGMQWLGVAAIVVGVALAQVGVLGRRAGAV
jgi:drug/metabolite transporter (DMT)-like permease